MNPGSRESAIPFASRKRPVPSCPVCEGRRFHYLFSRESHRLVRCTECNLALLNPQPSDEEMLAFAAKTDGATADRASAVPASLAARTVTAEKHLEILTRECGISRGKFLLIGCGDGALLAAAARHGFSVTGLAPSAEAADAARARLKTDGASGEVLAGPIEVVASRLGEFAVGAVTDALQLVRDPRELVQTLHSLLRPEGALLVALPPFEPLPRRGRPVVAGAAPPLFHFTRKTLESLLFSQGFRSLTWVSEGTSPPSEESIEGDLVLVGRAVARRKRPLLSLIVPVFNEAATFRTAFTRLLEHSFGNVDVEYIVVESNSPDGTRAIVNEFAHDPAIRILLEDRPRGKGHAVRAGLRVCQGDFIAIQDADLEYDVDDYDALLEPLLANREAFVLGARHGGRSRKMRQFAGQPVTSGLLNFGHWFFTTLLNVCLGVRLKDPFTMYKLFRRDCVHDLTFEANRFDFDWELVIKLIRKGYIPVEIPVNYRSRPFHEGKKVRVIRDPLSWFAALAKFRWQRLRQPTRSTSPGPVPRS